ncbi:MAG: hypothetical protein AAF533_12150 [Acidobacteriota bacterium]
MRRQSIGLISFVAVLAVAAVPAMAQGSLSGARTIVQDPTTQLKFDGQWAPAPIRTFGAASATFFTDRATFLADGDCSLDVNLDFEDGTVAAGGIIGCRSPNSWSAGALPCAFPNAAGSNTATADMQDEDPIDPVAGLFMIGPGIFGSPSNAMGANTFIDSFRIVFNCDESTCWGADVRNYIAAGNVDITVTTVGGDVFTDSILGTNAGNFWGIKVTGGAIAEVELRGTEPIPNNAEGIDNALFDECVTPAAGLLPEIRMAIEAIEAKLDANLDVAASSIASQDSVDAIEAKLDSQDPCRFQDLIAPLLGLEAGDIPPCP